MSTRLPFAALALSFSIGLITSGCADAQEDDASTDEAAASFPPPEGEVAAAQAAVVAAFPANLVSSRNVVMREDRRFVAAGTNRNIFCQVERLTNSRNEVRVDRGTLYRVDRVSFVNGPRQTPTAAHIGVRGFIEHLYTSPRGSYTRSASLLLTCWGVNAGYSPTLADITEALERGSDSLGFDFTFTPNAPLPPPTE